MLSASVGMNTPAAPFGRLFLVCSYQSEDGIGSTADVGDEGVGGVSGGVCELEC